QIHIADRLTCARLDCNLIVDRYSNESFGLNASQELSIPRRCYMNIGPSKRALLFLFLGCFGFASNGSAGESSGALLKAKKEAEAKGFIFETTRDAIVANAKKEGAIKVLSGLDPAAYSPM